MSDVTAIRLTMGEASTDKAAEAVARQSAAPSEVLEIRGVSPFHKALNSAASRVRTPYFIQVDADMVLDDNCFAALRSAVDSHVGLVVGQLRDPMMGPIQGVKLFRTECWALYPFQDTVSPDTDFVRQIEANGWAMVCAINHGHENPDDHHTFGIHGPDYSPRYTFGKFLIEGTRYRYRRKPKGLMWLMRRLRASRHPQAIIARLALGQGLFSGGEQDRLVPYGDNEELDRLHRFMAAGAGSGAGPAPPAPALGDDPHAAFRSGTLFARQALAARSFDSVATCLGSLAHDDRSNSFWLELGVARGLFASQGGEPLCRDLELLGELVSIMG